MGRATDIDAAIASLYDTAVDGGDWHDAIAAMCRAYRAESGVLYLVDIPAGASTILGWKGFDAAHLQHFSQHYRGLDPWTVACQNLRPGTPFVFTDAVPRAQLHKTEVWNDFLAPNRYDVEQGVGSTPLLHDGKIASFGVHRPRSLPDFTRSEARQLHRFVPHLKQALHLADRHEQVRQRLVLADNAIDALSFGMVVIGEDGRIALANRVALELSASDAGLVIKDTRLGARDSVAQAALGSAIAAALAQAGGRATRASAALKIPRGKGRPLAVVVAPLPPRAGDFVRQRPAAIVFITDPDRKAILAADTLRQLYGLTPAEVRVAELVVGGLSIEAAADALGVTRNTARNQLQNIYGKTGAPRLVDLVAVFTRLSVELRMA